MIDRIVNQYNLTEEERSELVKVKEFLLSGEADLVLRVFDVNEIPIIKLFLAVDVIDLDYYMRAGRIYRQAVGAVISRTLQAKGYKKVLAKSFLLNGVRVNSSVYKK